MRPRACPASDWAAFELLDALFRDGWNLVEAGRARRSAPHVYEVGGEKHIFIKATQRSPSR
eukprot:5110613-Alexandrium_andersonii.AAC.1